MIKDINLSGDANPENMTEVNGVLFFTADDGINGRELWKSDGTTDGTQMVKNINLWGSTIFNELKSFNGLLFFKINNGNEELWISNGTEAGTNRIKVGCAL